MFGQRYQTHFWTHPYRDGLKRNVNLDLEAQIHLTYYQVFSIPSNVGMLPGGVVHPGDRAYFYKHVFHSWPPGIFPEALELQRGGYSQGWGPKL